MDKETIIREVFTNLVAIHLTDYPPINHIIRTRYSVHPDFVMRDTTHFSYNKATPSLSSFQTGNLKGADWSGKKFAILAPFDKLILSNSDQLENFDKRDTYFVGNVSLPEGTFIIVSPQGIEDLLKIKILTKQDIANSLKTCRDSGYFEKVVDGITYRVYLAIDQRKYKIIDLVLNVVKEMGYNPDYEAGKYNREVAEVFDTQGGFHNDSIYSKLENFSLHINSIIDKIPVIIDIIHLFEGQGIKLPLKDYYGFDALGTESVSKNEDMEDSEGKTVTHDTLVLIHSTFDNDRKCLARNLLEGSMISREIDGFNNLQFPLIDAEYLLQQKMLRKYHKKIREYVKKYKKAVRTIPSYIIIECYELPELLNKRY
jgi:hypothetical protein